MAKGHEDVFSSFDPLLRNADTETSPWVNERYVPNLDLLRELLTIPLGAGEKQESGRPAKAFDSWIAHELRRAGFPKDAVWPRTRRPRVLPDDLAELEAAIENLRATLDAHEAATGKSLEPAAIRRAIRGVEAKFPGKSEAYILGDFYAKQIDVALTSWRRGPEVLISTKTMFSSYRKNLKNRHEEAVGEVFSLRARHPKAVMGYAYLVRKNIFDEEGAYPILFDILTRLERPGAMFDATMLLVIDWVEATTPALNPVTGPDEPAPELSSGSFFEKVVATALERSPVNEYIEVRQRKIPQQVVGLTDEDDEALDYESE
jgi:hypothetical protein